MIEAQVDPQYTSDEGRWQAVLDRDPAAEGLFYYAVRSTRIYCRPSCPVRRPKQQHVEFFTTSEAAEAAGYRPCLRCRPTMVSAEQHLVAQIRGVLDADEPAPSLAELGRRVGVSPFHLQRVFRHATGLTPREYAATRRLASFKRRVKEASSVTEALYDAGYGSSRALYEGATGDLGMRPRAYRRGGVGEEIAYTVVESPLGPMLVAATRHGVCALKFGAPEDLVSGLKDEFPRAALREEADALDVYLPAILAYLERRGPQPNLPLDSGGTAFQKRVWAALREIPPGQTRTYTEVAAAIGAPTAVRAVARACATNPLAVLIPCHRVLRRNHGLGGYRWGLERKEALLAAEQDQLGALT